MFDVMDAYSSWAWIYFISAAVFGGMFIVNLFLAVILDEFMRAQKAHEAELDVTAGAPGGRRVPAAMSAEEAEYKVGDEDKRGDAPFFEEGRLLSDGMQSTKGSRPPGEADPTDETDAAIPKGWRVQLRSVMLSETLGNVSTGFVVLNLFVMCLPYAGQSPQWEAMVELLGDSITYIFIGEMALKLVGMGCADYWSDAWNMLDGTIVSLSIGEILITLLLSGSGINISFLRMLRLLRLLRLLKAWPGLYKVVLAFIKAIPQIANLFILMFLIMAIFALLGMQAFGGTGLSTDSRWHFDYFLDAMLVTFGVFSGTWFDAFEVGLRMHRLA